MKGFNMTDRTKWGIDFLDAQNIVRKLDHHIDLINGHDDYIDVNFKLRAMY